MSNTANLGFLLEENKIDITVITNNKQYKTIVVFNNKTESEFIADILKRIINGTYPHYVAETTADMVKISIKYNIENKIPDVLYLKIPFVEQLTDQKINIQPSAEPAEHQNVQQSAEPTAQSTAEPIIQPTIEPKHESAPVQNIESLTKTVNDLTQKLARLESDYILYKIRSAESIAQLENNFEKFKKDWCL